jgi:hypothetical protein
MKKIKKERRWEGERMGGREIDGDAEILVGWIRVAKFTFLDFTGETRVSHPIDHWIEEVQILCTTCMGYHRGKSQESSSYKMLTQTKDSGVK